MERPTGKGINIMAVCYELLSYSEEMLKGTSLFSHKNKQLLRNFLRQNTIELAKYKRLESLLLNSEDAMKHYRTVVEDGEPEDIYNDLTFSQELVRNFINIYCSVDDYTIVEFNKVLQSFNKGEKVYSEGDVKHYIRKTLKHVQVSEISEDRINKIINNE